MKHADFDITNLTIFFYSKKSHGESTGRRNESPFTEENSEEWEFLILISIRKNFNDVSYGKGWQNL